MRWIGQERKLMGPPDPVPRAIRADGDHEGCDADAASGWNGSNDINGTRRRPDAAPTRLPPAQPRDNALPLVGNCRRRAHGRIAPRSVGRATHLRHETRKR
jgi:hypothetical protein